MQISCPVQREDVHGIKVHLNKKRDQHCQQIFSREEQALIDFYCKCLWKTKAVHTEHYIRLEHQNRFKMGHVWTTQPEFLVVK